MMLLQISSGSGPAECELAVGKFADALKAEIMDMQIISEVKSKYLNCYKSIFISTNCDVAHIQGAVKWVVQSPFRPKHKRKNWFIDVHLFNAAQKISFSEDAVAFQTFRSSGHGGQNINKVETGVRAIDMQTGISVVSTDARTQHMNKKIALNRLIEIISQRNDDDENSLKQAMRMQHELLERGNPIRIYTGLDFKPLIK